MQEFLTDINNYRELSGHSGAKILLCNSNKGQFVRKIAKDAVSSDRLELQAKKQSNFQKYINNLFYVPEVINSGKINDIFYFDMIFIKGPDGTQFLRYAELDEVKKLSYKIQEYLELIASKKLSYNKYDSNVSKLIDKINNICIQENIKDNISINIVSSLNKIKKLKEKETMSHGDLTLENFIISKSGETYLLDFLNPPINHWIMDTTKLLQDISGGWYQRKSSILPLHTVNYLENSIMYTSNQIKSTFTKFYQTILICNFLRILPYCQSDSEKKFIKDRIYFFGDRI